MKKLYYVICRKCRKFEKPKTSYLLEKIFVLSENEDEKIFEEEESIEILKIVDLINNIEEYRKR